ncbi:MAG: hypothetical protein R3C14_04820 [Caldilineaceae bacterium]
MAYSDFKSIEQIEELFDVTIHSSHPLFRAVVPASPSVQLTEVLAENIPLALNINTEKARSEMIIAPLLIEVRKLVERQIGLFSGIIEFNVDPQRNLNGFCDFLLSASPDQVFLTEPVACIVEAKNENIKSAYPQCVATMIGAQLFNERRGNAIETILGVITTGSNWKFLTLQGQTIAIDFDEYLISEPGKILGIFVEQLRPLLQRIPI